MVRLEQFARGEVVYFVLVVFCFVCALSESRKRKNRFVALRSHFLNKFSILVCLDLEIIVL